MLSDLDEEVQKMSQVHPCIVLVEGDCRLQFFQVVEKVIVGESNGFINALIDLIAVYYALDIAYPKPVL